MTYEIKQINNKPIWVAILSEPYNPATDSQGVSQEMASLTEDVQGHIYYISDIRSVDVEFSDIVTGLAQAFKSGVQTFYTDPRVTIITVATDELVKMATEAVKQEQYGSIDIKMYPSVEEAVAHAEELIAQEAA